MFRSGSNQSYVMTFVLTSCVGHLPIRPCVLNLPPKNGGFVVFFQMVSRSIHDIFAKQEGIVMLLVSFCS